MSSLRARLVLGVVLILAVFLGLTTLALERAFADAAHSARQERLLAQLYLLMGAAELEDGRLAMPADLAEARLSHPGSGLSARIFDATGATVWQSRSAVDTSQPEPQRLAPGARSFGRRDLPDGNGYLVAGFGVSWATGPKPRAFTFVVAEELTAMRREVARFRASLWGWLGAMAVAMLGALLIALAWGLKPLGRVTAEVSAVESGRQTRILGAYPNELRRLTDNLNALLAQEAARRQRLDQALGDLAHSLKTPLAVIEGEVTERGVDARGAQLLREQLARVNGIVEYQLQRARAGAAGAGALAPSVPVRQTVERLVASLDKVYRDKGVAVELAIDPELVFRGGEGDLMEMLGNLLDNAFKWCRSRVWVDATMTAGHLGIRVTDDGPGISGEASGLLLERGVRADEQIPGHGIGLAVVREIAAAYGGRLTIGPDLGGGPDGGAELWLRIPVPRLAPSPSGAVRAPSPIG
jgi:two-component system sensor histidine kinase PhoQ